MAKPYINDAIIGNGKILGCLGETGELIRLYWPHIDHMQHIEKMLIGIYDVRYKNSTKWFSEGNHQWTQKYLEDTNILETVAIDEDRKIKITLTDFCLPDMDVLVRNYEFKNEGSEDFDLGVIIASHIISDQNNLGNTLFDFSIDALIHYRHDHYLSISSGIPASQFQLGNNPFGAAWNGVLNGIDSIGMSPDAAVSWHVGLIKPGESIRLCVRMCFSDTLNSVKAMTEKVNSFTCNEMLQSTKLYWKDYLNKCNMIKTKNKDLQRVYKRSLLTFALMSDKETGGLLAAPEVDEGFTRCGRYAYCWARDAAFITEALDIAGLSKSVDRFYDWAIKVQDANGYWHQRYHLDGNIAPSWGIQVDETGTMLWGMLNHYEYTKNKEFLSKMWESIKKAITFLMNYIDEETGLPKPSFDLWEERHGEHAYSSAAVFGGVMSAAQIGRILEKDSQLIDMWVSFAQGIQESINKNLWSEERGYFLRSIRTKLNPFGPEPSKFTTVIQVNEKGYFREVTVEDARMDISLLGLTIPFHVFSKDNPKISKTIKVLEKVLSNPFSGGILRYEGDDYAGGNPWILTTLWLALYHIEDGNIDKARDYFEWAVKGRTNLDLFPEQVGKYDGKPAWVIPLTWSHAMFVLVFKKLSDLEIL